ncbi:class I SAM-dependent methyltransferase [Actinokineospora sp. NBRC 105648]|uniref:class I SAM-dependent DNA methyltransferase n=1 Tax=Actinokineospora sp. NBRC 105648 TaxID=3032206 RepID=UPI0024A22CE1|nr:class I SAM-dependent methyltransferase [Actinokineospora sp. NBRC 105648]GLZ36555.1 SAM-dependent methyltransferase [Actinokineospora sp. NBRC 105648]
MTWDGTTYQQRLDALAATGTDMHGEVVLVQTFTPTTVLDAGCGTGRVAIELANRGIEVEGADVDQSMLTTAARLAPHITWHRADLTTLDLGKTFDVVIMAGNVPLFTPPGTEPALVAGVARHVRPGGVLIAGFSLDRAYSLTNYDEHAAEAGLELVHRYATWSQDPFTNGDYAVSVHRRP